MIYVTCYFLIIGTDIKFNHTNKTRSVMTELTPFLPPGWERATEHRTARTSGGPYVFATQSWSRVHIVNCD